MNKKITAIAIGIMCFLLTIAICMQLKAVENSNIKPTQSISENKLRDEVLKWKEEYERVAKLIEEKERELDSQRKKATENDESSKELQDELENLQRLLGYTDLNGPGVTVILDDNRAISPEMVIDPSDYIVHDGDIMLIVNELRAAEAEAISINGQRLVATSEIMCVGPTIMVNGQKLIAPYEIKAIGYPELLEGSINLFGGYGDNLRSYGMTVDVQKHENITIYKYEGLLESKHLTSVN